MLQERLISILEIVAVSGRPISVAEIQQATNLPKPTCYRLVQTLQDTRLIQDNNSKGKFEIGDRLIRIALLGKSDIDVRKTSAALLKSTAIKFNETVFLARFRNSKVEIIHIENPDDPNRAYIHPGLGERPMHACSCSKAIAAFTEEGFRKSIINGTLKAYTEFTKTSQSELRKEFEAIEAQGYAHCDQEIDLGVASVAAPIMIGKIGATFAVGVVGPIRRMDEQTRVTIGSELISTAERISAAIQLCNVA